MCNQDAVSDNTVTIKYCKSIFFFLIIESCSLQHLHKKYVFYKSMKARSIEVFELEPVIQFCNIYCSKWCSFAFVFALAIVFRLLCETRTDRDQFLSTVIRDTLHISVEIEGFLQDSLMAVQRYQNTSYTILNIAQILLDAQQAVQSRFDGLSRLLAMPEGGRQPVSEDVQKFKSYQESQMQSCIMLGICITVRGWNSHGKPSTYVWLSDWSLHGRIDIYYSTWRKFLEFLHFASYYAARQGYECTKGHSNNDNVSCRT